MLQVIAIRRSSYAPTGQAAKLGSERIRRVRASAPWSLGNHRTILRHRRLSGSLCLRFGHNTHWKRRISRKHRGRIDQMNLRWDGFETSNSRVRMLPQVCRGREGWRCAHVRCSAVFSPC